MASRTQRAKVFFALKEYSGGGPWICLEPQGQTLDVIKHGFLGLDFRDEVSFDAAQQFMFKMNEMLEGVSFTDMSDVPSR